MSSNGFWRLSDTRAFEGEKVFSYQTGLSGPDMRTQSTFSQVLSVLRPILTQRVGDRLSSAAHCWTENFVV